MAARSVPLSLDQFHALYDGAKPAYEYWHGDAVQKPMPTVLHGLVQFILMMLLERAGWNPASEVRLKVVIEAEPVPDVIAVRRKFRGRYPATAPELCIEILSPGDSLAEALKKARHYVAWGTGYVWIIDPEKRKAWTMAGEILLEGSLEAGDTSIALEVLFAEVDRRLEKEDQLELG